MLSALCIVYTTSYLIQYRPSSSYVDLPKYFLAYLNLSYMYSIYSCTQWLLRVKGKHLGAAINPYAELQNCRVSCNIYQLLETIENICFDFCKPTASVGKSSIWLQPRNGRLSWIGVRLGLGLG